MVFLKVIKTVRNNWKKSVFFVCVSSYGVHYLNTKLKIDNLMKAYCEEAVKFGNHALDSYASPRHITIILNPVSKDKKCKNLYEKYVSPLFHCAGLKVSYVQTETANEARGLMGVMSNTDAVVVVGGNGTVHDSITGLFRREDADFVVPSMPIGIIPISKRILSFSQLFDVKNMLEKEGKKVGEVKLLAEAAMAVIRETIKNVDVVKVEGKEMGKPVFALNSFDFGILNDLANKADKYWYYGSRLKPYYPLIKGTLFKNLSSLVIPTDVNISYTEPCSGCSKCYQKFSVQKLQSNEITVSKRWWHSFIPRQLGSQPIKDKNLPELTVDYSKIINENCGVWKNFPKTNFLNLSIINFLKEGKLKLALHFAEDLKKTEIIKEGKEMFTSNVAQHVEAENIKIEFAGNESDQKDSNNSTVSVNIENNSTTNEEIGKKENVRSLWFRIDNEEYEPQTVEISLIPKKLRVYC